MSHKSGFLSGPEPIETEEKTEAQKIDERRPAAMATSKSMFDLAETDDTPAIEQKAASQEIISDSNISKKPKLQANDDFEKEMKERNRKEHEERAKRQKKLEEQEKAEAEKRQKEIAEKLEESQTLDEEELREEIKEEIATENQDQLYPDAKPLSAAVEDEIWRARTEKGAQIAGRAKIVDVFDSKLHKVITFSYVLNIIATILTVIGFLTGSNKSLRIAFFAVSIILIVLATIILIQQAEKTKRHAIPSDQSSQFKVATIIPGQLIRLAFIGIVALVPITGKFVCIVVGAAIGGSVHYTILNRYNIYVSLKDTLINTTVFLCLLAFYLFTPSASSGSILGMKNQATDVIAFALGMVEFVLGDRTAMLMALYTNK